MRQDGGGGGTDGTWVGFLVTCFVVVGLAGIFASFAVTVPYERALARIGSASEASTVAAALQDAAAEAHAIAIRVRILLCVLTVMAAGFGAMLLLVGRRRGGPGSAVPAAAAPQASPADHL